MKINIAERRKKDVTAYYCFVLKQSIWSNTHETAIDIGMKTDQMNAKVSPAKK